ncbi:MAG: 5,10-methylenetetrahydrofolate reductase [Chloroflexi bacterium]|nr:5,10-methylenetetrahydrofolate reductase [Chloroflexota bacterium]
MKITKILENKKKPIFSFELFPAKSEKAEIKLQKVIEKLAAMKPDFVSVTFGAGGSTREGSFQLLKKLIQEKDLEVVGYFAGYGLGPKKIDKVLDSYRELGVDNILIVRGDVPHLQEDFIPDPDSFPYATDLLAYIRPKYDFCIGVAAYPEGHIEAQSLKKDMEYLKMKVDLGADYIVTNYCYDNLFYFDFVSESENLGIDLLTLPGVMPIYSIKMMESLAKLCGATITGEIEDGLAKIPEGDKATLSKFGIDFATKQSRGLIEGGARGIHLYTMDRSKASMAIVSKLKEENYL